MTVAVDEARVAMMLVRTTLASEGDARVLARRLVEVGSACCVHVLPLLSVYRWEGRVEEASEWLVEARVLPEGVEAVREAVSEGHPYALPLVETVGPTEVDAAYAAWARGGSTGS